MSGGLWDLHQHVLWGLDDGPGGRTEMQDMLLAAARQGIARLAATPHACPGFYPFDLEGYRLRLEEARAYCAAQGLALEILAGAEITYTERTAQALRSGAVPALGDTDCALIELWRKSSWAEIRRAACAVLRAGFRPVLAHVERLDCFVWEPRRAIALRRELDLRYQANAGLFLNPQSPLVRRFRRIMLEERAVDLAASDAHDLRYRPVNLRAAHQWLEARCGAEYAARLTQFKGD